MTKKYEHQYGLLIVENSNEPYGHVTAKVVRVEKDCPRNIVSQWDNPAGLWFDGLTVTCQIDMHKGGEPYGIACEYQELFRVRAEDARRIANTFSLLKRGLDKIEKRFGPSRSFSEHVVRVADVLKIDLAFFQKDKHGRGYSASDFAIREVGESRYVIDALCSVLSSAKVAEAA